jgi:hypothetical protein
MQSPTNFPTASAWLEIVVTKAPDLSVLVSPGVAFGLLVSPQLWSAFSVLAFL